MREVKLSNGFKIEVRGLLRRELRALKADGMDPAALSMNIADEALDRVFALVLAPDVQKMLEDMPNSDSMRIWRGVMTETYGAGEEEEKNSSPAGNGKPMPSGSPTVKSVEEAPKSA
jgi:hypothetical protein